jgi:Helix-turn-helix domain
MYHVRTKSRALIPFDRREAITVSEAAEISGRSVVTVRNWIIDCELGRHIGGHWAVSRVALTMFLDGDLDALAIYLSGDRDDCRVVRYFDRLGIVAMKR